MENLITDLQTQSNTIKALAVSAGGLIGVFATLTVFFLLIWLSNKLGKKKA